MQFYNTKYEIEEERTLSLDKTNASFIELHRINISIKDKNILLLYFDKDNLFLYNREVQITLQQLILILQEASVVSNDV